jgi:putative membrane-bound dehydrogenase-like protein
MIPLHSSAMKKHRPSLFLLCAIASFFVNSLTSSAATSGPIRVLFLGHESEQHDSNKFYPMIQQALGRDAIYFDYVTSVAEAFDDATHLNKFDAVLIYANHATIEPNQWMNLKSFVENGGGFLPIHCASWCFANEPGFDQLVGGRFDHHKTGVFKLKTLLRQHSAVRDVPELEAWDETYVHKNHNTTDRIVLQVRDVAGPDDNITKPEPWTWIRTQGKGRVYYTASGHDERVWGQGVFHEMLKKGILWSVGDARKAAYDQFIAHRAPLKYVVRDNIPNYEKRPAPLPYQLPLSPEDSLKYTRAPVGFHLELFAAEPMIVNPIYLQWDERGRLWVAESRDYPNEITGDRKGNDSIKILEDTNRDGKADKVTVFADGLNIPTSFTFSRGGIIVAHAPDFLFFKDTDGDDKADVREVLFTGWGINDTHAGPSNLRYGFDNQIWGTVGYARFRGELGGEKHDFGMGVYRFKPDASSIEFLYQFNNNTWGLSFNSSGDVFGSTANNNPSFFGGLPQGIYGGTKRMSAKMIADTPTFHPITPNVRQVDVFGGYTAAAGHALATSAAFPESWRDRNAFVAGPTGNLLGMYRIDRDGSGYTAKNAFSLVASADEWFSPILAEVGPDGHLWISDWYNFIIQHNPTPNPNRGGYKAQTGKGNAHVNPNRDRQHGRIYRLVRDDAPESKIISLANSNTKQLLAALKSDNLFWRATAQRLLVDGDRKDAAPELKQLANSAGPAAIHALWSLHGLRQLDEKTHAKALINPDAAVRRNAIKALSADATSARLLYDTATLADPDLATRREAFIKLASLKGDQHAATASRLLKNQENADDEWLALALRAAGGSVQTVAGFTYGKNLVGNPSFEDVEAGAPSIWKIRQYSGPRHSVEYAPESRPKFVRSGRYSLRISSKAGHDTSLQQPVKLKPDAEYRLSGWVKSEKLTGARGAQFNIHEQRPNGRTQAISDDTDWTGVQVRFRTAGQPTQYSLNALFGGWGRGKGTAWFDDVALVEVIPVKSKGASGPVKGLATRGQKIFLEHPLAACNRCHALEGKGGFVGPYLDGIAVRKERDYIYKSLIDPTAELAEGFDKLGSSPMPPMNIVLSDQEIADVMAFLMTLKKPADPKLYENRKPEVFE